MSPTIAPPRAVVPPAAVRERLLRMHADTGLGHVGSNLSCLDILIALHHSVMGDDDTFVLSKGHGAGALYAVLWSRGLLTDAELDQWCRDGSPLPGHPVASVPGVDFSTGSLGHGSALALGMAMGRLWQGHGGQVFCLTSDGEWQEGSTWEALMLAAHRRPPNLTLIVDANGLQGFGSTRETLSMDDLAPRIRAFGVVAFEVDGHDPLALAEALTAARGAGFSVVVARTTKGRGTSYQGTVDSHYLPLPAADRPGAGTAGEGTAGAGTAGEGTAVPVPAATARAAGPSSSTEGPR